MYASSSLRGLSVWRAAAALIVVAAIVAGCSGVGTGGTGGTTRNPVAITGKVADGYLANASVFLDRNGNYRLDAGEPFTTSDPNGSFSLNVDPDDVGRYPVVAVAIKGQTIDLDTGLSVANGFTLSMPALAVSGAAGGNFISPLSTQVRELLETGKYATLQQAMDQVATRMGLSIGTNMLVDYKAANNAVMTTAAKNIASVMDAATTAGLVMDAASGIVDVNRYRSMTGAIFQNLPFLSAVTSQTTLSNAAISTAAIISSIPAGQPFINMSAAFRN